MSGLAKRAFIEGIGALEASVNSPLVSGADTVGAFLRRGLQVVGYGLLETFITDRLGEVSAHANSGISHVSDLPEKLQRAAFSEAIRVAASKMQWLGTDLSDILTFSSELGRSLSAASGPVNLSPLTWQWKGSNMGVEDLSRALRLFHVKAPFIALNSICGRMNFPVTDTKVAMAGLLRERNSSAHDSNYQVSNLVSRSTPTQLLALGCTTDTFISLAADRLRVADQSFLSDPDWLDSSRVAIRFLHARPRDWAEMPEGATRAVRVATDRTIAFKRACAASLGKAEIVVVQDQTRHVLDWACPDVP